MPNCQHLYLFTVTWWLWSNIAHCLQGMLCTKIWLGSTGNLMLLSKQSTTFYLKVTYSCHDIFGSWKIAHLTLHNNHLLTFILQCLFYNIGHHLEDVHHHDGGQDQDHQLDAGDTVDQVQAHHINLSFVYICGHVLYILIWRFINMNVVKLLACNVIIINIVNCYLMKKGFICEVGLIK